MEFKELENRALEIRMQYRALNKAKGHHPWSALTYTEGFVGDVGDLMKLVMAKAGYRGGEQVDEKIEHELADCLWSVMAIAHELEVDLEQSFIKTMNELEARIANDHG